VRFFHFLHAPTQNSTKIWRGALIVVIPKPVKPLGDSKSYRPISLQCVPFKILERRIHTRVEPIIDPLLMQEQLGFRHRRLTLDQVTLLTQDIKDSFLVNAKKRARAVLSSSQQPTTAYHRDLTSHCYLTYKHWRLQVSRHWILQRNSLLKFL